MKNCFYEKGLYDKDKCNDLLNHEFMYKKKRSNGEKNIAPFFILNS